MESIDDNDIKTKNDSDIMEIKGKITKLENIIDVNNKNITELNSQIKIRDNNIQNLLKNTKNYKNYYDSNLNYINDLKSQIDSLKGTPDKNQESKDEINSHITIEHSINSIITDDSNNLNE